MPIENIETVFYTSLFLVPGFLMKTIVSMFTPAKRSFDINCFLEYLAYSLLNYFIINLFFSNHLKDLSPLCLILVFVSCSIVLSIITIFALRLLSFILFKCHIDYINEYASAWDYMFYERFKGQEQHFEVKLVNGEIKYGIFSNKSYVPVHDDGADLYLEIETDSNFDYDTNNYNSLYITKDLIQQIIVHKVEEKK